MRAASDSFGGDIAAAVEQRRERARGARVTERDGREGEGQREVAGDAAVGDAEPPAEADSVEKSRDGESGGHMKAAREIKKKWITKKSKACWKTKTLIIMNRNKAVRED